MNVADILDAARVDLLPETRAFLRDWLDWVERGAPQQNPYTRKEGLCDNSKRFDETRRVYADLEHALRQQFPFGEDDYMARAVDLTQHECPKRLAFARASAA